MTELRSYINHVIETFNWTYAVEFVLIGLAVYVVYRFLRGTRGARVFRGYIFMLVTAFLVVQLLASALQLDRVLIIYNSLIQTAVMAAVIIFQPEMRRALIQIGQSPLFRTFIKRQSAAFIDILSKATEQLSRDKIGALIAIERDTDLPPMVQVGTMLNAELSVDLLLTIFWPGSALHDMGVIVRQNRIVAAGCEFPLTQNPPLGSKYGARHRAALGMSEESDALIIVVSEETGEISIAQDGQFHENLSIKDFHRRLTHALVRDESSASVAMAIGLNNPPPERREDEDGSS